MQTYPQTYHKTILQIIFCPTVQANDTTLQQQRTFNKLVCFKNFFKNKEQETIATENKITTIVIYNVAMHNFSYIKKFDKIVQNV